MRFDHIFFDSGGTLYNPEKRSTSPIRAEHRVFTAIVGMGIDVSAARLEEAICRQIKVCKQRMGAGYSFFRLMEAVVHELGLPLGSEDAACLADAWAGPRYASWLFPHTKEVLQSLHDNGYKMGIIANTVWPGFCMDRAFAGVGLIPFLSARVYSCDIGIAKPSPLIFKYAERISGMEGRGKRILFVGNDLEADIKGAAAVGWSTAFRRSGGNSSSGIADLEFDDITELAHFVLS